MHEGSRVKSICESTWQTSFTKPSHLHIHIHTSGRVTIPSAVSNATGVAVRRARSMPAIALAAFFAPHRGSASIVARADDDTGTDVDDGDEDEGEDRVEEDADEAGAVEDAAAEARGSDTAAAPSDAASANRSAGDATRRARTRSPIDCGPSPATSSPPPRLQK